MRLRSQSFNCYVESNDVGGSGSGARGGGPPGARAAEVSGAQRGRSHPASPRRPNTFVFCQKDQSCWKALLLVATRLEIFAPPPPLRLSLCLARTHPASLPHGIAPETSVASRLYSLVPLPAARVATTVGLFWLSWISFPGKFLLAHLWLNYRPPPLLLPLLP